jgi:hypothetical protein
LNQHPNLLYQRRLIFLLVMLGPKSETWMAGTSPAMTAVASDDQ